MTTRFPYRAGLLCVVTFAALTAGCSSKGTKVDPDNPFGGGNVASTNPRAPLSERELRLEADQSYRKAHESLISGDYETAITRFSQLIARYPFSDYATQSELEKIYAQYRSFKPDEAVLAADRFLREHPRFAHADYVSYIKGLTDFDRGGGIVDYLPLDSSKRDVTDARRAFDDFALLLQKYPNSPYVGDARKRMIYLRNRIASHELSVASYYTRRGAWVAAAKRAEAIIAEYPGAPATADALLLLQECYTKLGQKQQVDEVTQLIAANSASIAASKLAPPKPGERSVVNAAATTTASTPPQAVSAAAPPAPAQPAPRPGFFGFLHDLLDGGLDKTYTVGNAVPDSTAAKAPAAAGSSARSQPDFSAPASLTTGPNSGPDTVIAIPPVFDSPAPAQAATPEPAAAEKPASATAPAASAAASAEVPKKDAPKEKKGGFLDFLNKTYTIGGSGKKNDEAPAPVAAPAAAPAAATAPGDGQSNGKIRAYLDYEDEDAAKKKAAEAAGDSSTSATPAQ